LIKRFSIHISPRAQKQIKKLESTVLPHVLECLEALETDPHPTGVEKLNQDPNFWRIKAGHTHRVIYTILADSNSIIVALVSPRREVYREVSNLNHAQIVRVALNENFPQAAGIRH
jgi:mRNA-degrading endonuclease RelE of RelBE toxin-antitoxin system